MINSERCTGHQITLQENKYVFDCEPKICGCWLQMIDTEIINCVLERIQLNQEIEDSDCSTPIGTSSTTLGYLSQNHLTLIWDKATINILN